MTSNTSDFQCDECSLANPGECMKASHCAHRDGEAMSVAEIATENATARAKLIADFSGPVVSFDVREPYYLASCDSCGWVGSSEQCGTDAGGDDSDVYCPRCHASGADCGKVATLHTPPPLATAAVVDAERCLPTGFAVKLARAIFPAAVETYEHEVQYGVAKGLSLAGAQSEAQRAISRFEPEHNWFACLDRVQKAVKAACREESSNV